MKLVSYPNVYYRTIKYVRFVYFASYFYIMGFFFWFFFFIVVDYLISLTSFLFIYSAIPKIYFHCEYLSFFFFYIIMSPIYIRNKFCNHNIADCGNSGGNTNLNIAVYVFSTKSLNYRSGLGTQFSL